MFGDQDVAATIHATTHESPGDTLNDLGNAPIRPSSLDVDISSTPPPQNTFEINMSGGQISGYKDMEKIKDIYWNETHEWVISGSNNHPFHLHLYHMLIVEPGGCGPQHVEGEMYDTISAPDDCTVRFLTADIGQKMVLVSDILPVFNQENSHKSHSQIMMLSISLAALPRPST